MLAITLAAAAAPGGGRPRHWRQSPNAAAYGIPDAELHAEVETLVQVRAEELRLEAAGPLAADEADAEEEEEPMLPADPLGEETWEDQEQG